MEREMGFLVIAAAFAAAVLTLPAAESAAVPAIFVFGDSTVDVGNNNFLPGSPPKANFPPNGIDFPGSKPTGRFSNGYDGIDYFAKRLGFEKSPPAYLSISKAAVKPRGGVNFAAGGSGILDTTAQNVSIPLNQQISYFRGVSRADRRFLSKSIFYFSTGNNDMILFFAASGILNQTQQDLFVAQLAKQFKNQLETLYKLGARKFLVFGSSLIGCIPILRLSVPSGECVEYLNNLSQQFNRATKIALKELATNLKGFSYSFINVYDIVSLLSSEPLKYGFTETASACCGSGRLNAETGCSSNVSYCSNRDQYFYWDQYHPTQAFYKNIVRSAFLGKRYASPVTVNQLIRL